MIYSNFVIIGNYSAILCGPLAILYQTFVENSQRLAEDRQTLVENSIALAESRQQMVENSEGETAFCRVFAEYRKTMAMSSRCLAVNSRCCAVSVFWGLLIAEVLKQSAGEKYYLVISKH